MAGLAGAIPLASAHWSIHKADALPIVHNRLNSPFVGDHSYALSQLLARLGIVADALIELGVLLPGKMGLEVTATAPSRVKRFRVVLTCA